MCMSRSDHTSMSRSATLSPQIPITVMKPTCLLSLLSMYAWHVSCMLNEITAAAALSMRMQTSIEYSVTVQTNYLGDS